MYAFIYACLKIFSLYYLLFSAFPNTGAFMRGKKDNIKMTE